jgi:F-type H+-transporting ATPase subunit b
MQIIPDLAFAAFMTLPFLVTVVALNVILVKPMREYLESRHAAIGGARHEATKLNADADAKLTELEARLAAAREVAAGIRAQHRERGLDAERALLGGARKQAEAELGEALTGIAQEVEVAKAAIADTARTLSADIAGRVLGRGLNA